MENENKESYEQMYERIVKPMIPLNDCVVNGYYSIPDDSISRHLMNKLSYQDATIIDLVKKVEDLTRIVNVLAIKPEMIDRRKPPM